MSMLPYVFNDWPRWPSRLLEQDFGLPLTPDDMLTSVMPWSGGDYLRPWRQLTQDLGSSIKTDKDKFQVNLDVQHFSPDEITVKTANGELIIEGKHEEKQDQHGFVSRHFVRRYTLPEGCKEDTVQSRLSSDGVLTITAPRESQPALEGERVVPIQHTGPVRKEIKDASADVKKDTKKKK